MKRIGMREVVRMALTLLGYQVAFGFIGFMVIPAMLGATDLLRIPLVGVLILAALAFIFLDGSYKGERDSVMSESLDKLAEKGTYTPSEAEEAKRYRRIKGILAALIAALPLFIVSLIVALTAQPYTYTLQGTPSWLAGYFQRPEIGNAVSYLQIDAASAGLTDILRVISRFFLFPYVGLFGSMSDEMTLLFDRISPLLALVLPAASAIGYQFGPRRRAKNAKAIDQAKRTPRRRLKKDRRKTGPKEKNQLI